MTGAAPEGRVRVRAVAQRAQVRDSGGRAGQSERVLLGVVSVGSTQIVAPAVATIGVDLGVATTGPAVATAPGAPVGTAVAVATAGVVAVATAKGLEASGGEAMRAFLAERIVPEAGAIGTRGIQITANVEAVLG